MPDDLKKKQQKKGKEEPKEQRKSRQSKQPKSTENKTNKSVVEPLIKDPEKPAYEEPGPEFFKGLKRETDDILKITEEEYSKYKKKEIKSNWAKYEMPIESYEEIKEQEDMGANYEKLIQASLSIGGHFQFKHEKTWDLKTGPSVYDKYFDINMDNLAIALSTIPFYERNNIDQSVFSESDILTMNNRATKYKQKYYNDKSYSIPEIDSQNKILQKLKENPVSEKIEDVVQTVSELDDNMFDIKTNEIPSVYTEDKPTDPVGGESRNKINSNVIPSELDKTNMKIVSDNLFDNVLEKVEEKLDTVNEVKLEVTPVDIKSEFQVNKRPTIEEKVNPIIQSPEDLEKWLDDFLDE